ncbi:uricase [Conidiobolus coronatus NRRL 28638]|uniref:Uricase n=1 Tax=Conidiobolus coronatus (strain ATCC 28846 / CBS 209.66 / NRRL 28638) TaxID=796925 RepID=A0A137PBS3_CONC2|nr:uricase [Conidiobolus coronatus NRRL 28638]|eukprot:KXN72467.1 uricase [Conidiobolus coronatus NRRL 28638]
MASQIRHKLDFQEYGKQNVRFVRVFKQAGGQQSLVEYTVTVLLSGPRFTASYTEADNNDVIATDTVKNIIYVVANQSKALPNAEKFSVELAEFFLNKYPSHVQRVNVVVEQQSWDRQSFNGAEHQHAFVGNNGEKHSSQVIATQETPQSPIKYEITSKLDGLTVLKTTGSSFKHFYADEYRTLPDAEDRILSTVVTLEWNYSTFNNSYSVYETPFDEIRAAAKHFALDEFANKPSPSVQATLYDTANRIINKYHPVDKVSISLPNRHYFAADLPIFKQLGQDKKVHDLYVPIAHPNGLIKATVKRNVAPKL